MEDEELMNLILEKLYSNRLSNGIQSIRTVLNGDEVYFRKNQLNRVMSDIKNNGFAILSVMDDDYQAELSPEGVVYCEEVLMIR